jgi:hypothetical protein
MKIESRLVQRHNDKTDQQEWALVSKKSDRVLKWFGARKPSDEAVKKEERRVQYFKHQGSLLAKILAAGLPVAWRFEFKEMEDLRNILPRGFGVIGVDPYEKFYAGVVGKYFYLSRSPLKPGTPIEMFSFHNAKLDPSKPEVYAGPALDSFTDLTDLMEWIIPLEDKKPAAAGMDPIDERYLEEPTRSQFKDVLRFKGPWHMNMPDYKKPTEYDEITNRQPHGRGPAMAAYPMLARVLTQHEPYPTKKDLKDAFHVINVQLNVDETEDQERALYDAWQEGLQEAKLETWKVGDAAKKFSITDHRRRIKEQYLDNPIIVAKIGEDYVVLDGSHRLITKFETKAKEIQALIVPLPWAEDLTAMSGETLSVISQEGMVDPRYLEEPTRTAFKEALPFSGPWRGYNQPEPHTLPTAAPPGAAVAEEDAEEETTK